MNFYQMHPPQFVGFVLVIEASSDFTRNDRMSMQALPSNHRVNSSNGFKVLFTLSLSISSLSLPPPPGPNISLDLNISFLLSLLLPLLMIQESYFESFIFSLLFHLLQYFCWLEKQQKIRGAMKRKRFCVLFVFQLLRCISCFNTIRYYRYQDIN